MARRNGFIFLTLFVVSLFLLATNPVLSEEISAAVVPLPEDDQIKNHQSLNQISEQDTLQTNEGEVPLETDPHAEGHHQEGEEEFGQITPDDPQFYVYIIIAFVLVSFAGICSGLTVGYLGITNLQLDIIIRNGTAKEKTAASSIKTVIKDHHLLLSTLLLSNAIAMEALPIFLDAICPAWMAILISTVAVVIIGEIVPQAYCTGKHQLALGQFFASFTKFLMKVLYVFTYPVAKSLDKLLGVHDNSRLERKEDLVGLIELQQLSKEDLKTRGNHTSDQQRGLTEEEIKLITSTMLLREKNVTKYMQPYAKIFKLSEKENLTPKLMEMIARSGFSNIVIHGENNKSKVIGILKAKSLIDQVDAEPNIPINQLDGLKEPIIISNHTNMLELMMIFQVKKSTVALVCEQKEKPIDENVLHQAQQDPTLSERLVDSKDMKGFIIGLISLKDVFEVMINKILQDEDQHHVDTLQQAVRTLEPVQRKAVRTKTTQFSSIRQQY